MVTWGNIPPMGAAMAVLKSATPASIWRNAFIVDVVQESDVKSVSERFSVKREQCWVIEPLSRALPDELVHVALRGQPVSDTTDVKNLSSAYLSFFPTIVPLLH